MRSAKELSGWIQRKKDSIFAGVALHHLFQRYCWRFPVAYAVEGTLREMDVFQIPPMSGEGQADVKEFTAAGVHDEGLSLAAI